MSSVHTVAASLTTSRRGAPSARAVSVRGSAGLFTVPSVAFAPLDLESRGTKPSPLVSYGEGGARAGYLLDNCGQKIDRLNDVVTGAIVKRMLADAMLNNAALKDLLGKKW